MYPYYMHVCSTYKRAQNTSHATALCICVVNIFPLPEHEYMSIYIHIYICMYVCMYVCMCTYACIHVYECV